MGYGFIMPNEGPWQIQLSGLFKNTSNGPDELVSAVTNGLVHNRAEAHAELDKLLDLLLLED